MREINKTKKFELNDSSRYEYERGEIAARRTLELGKACMYFSRVERVPRYADGERENDAEHSFMLSLVAPEIAAALKLPLDTGLVSQYACVHDLIELKSGDIPTFLFTENEQLQKELDEQAALRELQHELPPHTAAMLMRYETQSDTEARFVRYVDKLLPIVVDIIGAGKKVMREDYQVASVEELRRCHADLHQRLVQRFGGEFPELDIAHQLLSELFEFQFETALE